MTLVIEHTCWKYNFFEGFSEIKLARVFKKKTLVCGDNPSCKKRKNCICIVLGIVVFFGK